MLLGASVSSPRICLENPAWVSATPMPTGSALCICTGPQVYTKNVVTCSAQTAVKAAPWGVRGCPWGMGPPGQGGTLVARNALARWLCAPRQGRSSSVPCPSLWGQITRFHATLPSPTLLWDSLAISMLLEHARHGSAWCARSMLGHLGAWCPCTTTVGVSWCTSCTVSESPQLCAG